MRELLLVLVDSALRVQFPAERHFHILPLRSFSPFPHFILTVRFGLPKVGYTQGCKEASIMGRRIVRRHSPPPLTVEADERPSEDTLRELVEERDSEDEGQENDTPSATTQDTPSRTSTSNTNDYILVTLVVNHTQAIYIELDVDSPSAKVTVEADPGIQHKPRLNGRVEVECVFFTANELSTTNPVHRKGILVIDGSHTLDLGPLQTSPPIHCATLVDQVPKTFTFEVLRVDSPAIHPSERLLMNHTLAILEKDEYFGSVCSSHLQNQVRDLPFYDDVIGPLKTWNEFLKAHQDKWDLFKYAADEIQSAGLGSRCRDTDIRVVAKCNADVYKQGDVVRAQQRDQAEVTLHELLVTKLRQRSYKQSELLAELMKESCFLTIITPNLSKMVEYFQSFPDRFFVVRHYLHPIIIEAKKQGIVDDPKFDRWDNTVPPKYSFDFNDCEGGE